jgi:hypothetical protein
LRLAVTKGPNSLGVSLTSPEVGNRSSFENVVFSNICNWSSGQSSWLQIRRTGFDSRALPEKKVVGLERGPLSLVSTTELLDRKVAAPV